MQNQFPNKKNNQILIECLEKYLETLRLATIYGAEVTMCSNDSEIEPSSIHWTLMQLITGLNFQMMSDKIKSKYGLMRMALRMPKRMIRNTYGSQ